MSTIGARRMRKVVWFAALTILAGIAVRRSCGSELRIASFNIRTYGCTAGDRCTPTDDERLREILRGLDADVIAVQEIQAPERLARLAASIDGRRYRFARSACGGGLRMHVGLVYDEARVRLVETREFPELDPDGGGRCVEGDRPGLLGELEADGERFALLVVHMAAGRDGYPKRQAQWARAITIATRHRAERGTPVGILGDVNTTGFRDDDQGERSDLEARLGAADMTLLTRDLDCTEYYEPEPGRFAPSLLDHIAVHPSFPITPKASKAKVHGYCVETRCAPLAAPPADYLRVSDHCPITVGN